MYIAQAQTRHAVTAIATEDSTLVLRADDSTATRVNARWQDNGTEHTRSLNWGHAVKTGDPLKIWVDGNGDRVDAPAPTSQAGADAVGVAYAAWQTVALTVIGIVCWGRRRLDRRRDSAWERCKIADSLEILFLSAAVGASIRAMRSEIAERAGARSTEQAPTGEALSSADRAAGAKMPMPIETIAAANARTGAPARTPLRAVTGNSTI